MAGNGLFLTPETPIGAQLAEAARSQRVIFFAGLPGVGKSRILQQQVLIAAAAGRRIHLMQWDSARRPFETPEALAKFPETDGVTHPAIRKAVGVWARGAIARWHASAKVDAILIGELPIVGGRLVEIVRCVEDDAEVLLGGATATFFLPVPSVEVRARIEELRQASIAAPKHEKEARDAPINVVRQHWADVRRAAVELGLTEATTRANPPYDRDIYAQIFAHLLRHRRCIILPIDIVFFTSGSVYDLSAPTWELEAAPLEVTAIFDALDDVPADPTLNWYDV